MMKRLGKLFWFTAVLTVLACTTCIRVEILNVKVDHYLPIQWPADYQGNRAWRECLTGRDHLMRLKVRAYQVEHQLSDNTPVPDNLQAKFNAEIDAYLPWATASNQLASLLESWGLLQYLIIPVALLCAIRIAVRRRSRFELVSASIFTVLNLMCGTLMFYREYFTSLGW